MRNLKADNMVETEHIADGLTIAECLEAVYNYVSHEVVFHRRVEPKPDSAPKVRPDAEYAHLCKVLELTERQVDIFSVIVEESLGGHAGSSDIAARLGMTKIGFISIKPELDVLAQKRYIIYNPTKVSNTTFYVPTIVVDAITENRRPTIQDLGGFSVVRFARQLDSLFNCFFRDDLDENTLLKELVFLYSNNPDNPLVVAYNSYNMGELAYYEKLLSNYMLYKNLLYEINSFEWSEYCKLFGDSDYSTDIMFFIDGEDLDIQKKGLVCHDSSDGFEDAKGSFRFASLFVKEIGKCGV